jgi:hypothetical protein
VIEIARSTSSGNFVSDDEKHRNRLLKNVRAACLTTESNQVAIPFEPILRFKPVALNQSSA